MANHPSADIRNISPWAVLGLAVAVALAAGLPSPARGQPAVTCSSDETHAAAPSQPPLRFGIYPGGPVGSVYPTGPPRPENRAQRRSALRALAGSSPFVIRLYSAWTGNPEADDVGRWLDDEIADYGADGLLIELVVRYRPAAPDAVSAPSAFAGHVAAIVRRHGSNPRLISLQVTNEANVPGAPDASDGAYAGAAEALVAGVIAAKDQARGDGHGQLRVGFNWAVDERPAAAGEFWAALGRLGGPRFAAAVDWVGLDSYPGTWVPQIALSNLLPSQAAEAMKDSVRLLRECLMPAAGLGSETAVHIAENGFPTGPGRSEELQAQTLDAMVRSVHAIRAAYGVSDYRWFDLRDSSTADPNVESHYGITRDDYSPKPAFATYRDLVRRFGGDAGTAGQTAPAPGSGPAPASPSSTAMTAENCRRSPVRVAIPRWKSRRVTALVVRVGRRVVTRVARRPIPRSLRIHMPPGRASVSIRLTARRHGRRLQRLTRRSYRIC